MEVILVQGTHLLSKLIMAVTKSWTSHCAIRYGGPDSDWIVHSTVGGVQPDWWFYFSTHYPKIKRYKISFEDVGTQALDDVVKSIAHDSYDYLGLVGFALYLLCKKCLFGLLKKNPFGTKNSYTCVEVPVKWMKRCNELDPQLKLREFESELTRPCDLEEYWDSLPNLFIPIPNQ